MVQESYNKSKKTYFSWKNDYQSAKEKLSEYLRQSWVVIYEYNIIGFKYNYNNLY